MVFLSSLNLHAKIGRVPWSVAFRLATETFLFFLLDMVIMSQMNREFGVSSAFAYETHHDASTNKELSDS